MKRRSMLKGILGLVGAGAVKAEIGAGSGDAPAEPARRNYFEQRTFYSSDQDMNIREYIVPIEVEDKPSWVEALRASTEHNLEECRRISDTNLFK